MEFPIAVICAYDRTFRDFMKLVKDGDTKLLKITDQYQARGVTFSGYVVLIDAEKLKDYEEILYNVKARIKP